MRYLILLLMFVPLCLLAQSTERMNYNKFRQLSSEWPTPNVYRTADGSPGPNYWQQQVDYDINITLDDTLQRIYGEEEITYHNNSPQTLRYLWVQLDQNVRAKNSDSRKINSSNIKDNASVSQIRNLNPTFDGGFKLEYVKDQNDKDLSHYVLNTMMRITPENSIKPGEKTTIKIKWWYNINDRMKIGGRSGYEYFPEDDNYLYTIAQFFPRMCVYDDINGWQHNQFWGRGEFALPFGDYDVKITVPEDHLVASTGTLQNEKSILPADKIDLLEKARKSKKDPVIIYSQEEAEERERSKSYKTKTWHFKAENVRDFAFASSRKFIWDAMGTDIGDRTVLAMSMYPKEGNPLWEQYSTKAVAHTLKWYSHYTIDYPYPVAWSIHAARIGMEYPMICFNFGRPEKDGTYSQRIKYGMIGVIIHEVGHNFFPMIVNSDERQWTWMDEGLNSFVQYLTEQQWERNFPSRRGPAYKITDYMSSPPDQMVPIMTNSESIIQFGNNAYGKPATALNILRETIIGRENFDFAFKTYAEKWAFKHPSPYDFFRTMEDASGMDLDWFWRGWFYSTDYVDIAIKNVQTFELNQDNLNKRLAYARANDPEEKYIANQRNKTSIEKTYDEQDTALVDFYTTYDPYAVDQQMLNDYEQFSQQLSEADRAFLERPKYVYQVDFENKGGLIMPIIFNATFEDNTDSTVYIPAQIWNKNHENVSKVFLFDQKVTQIELDPYLETADIERSNNYYPPKEELSPFKLFELQYSPRENPMQRARRLEEIKKEE